MPENIAAGAGSVPSGWGVVVVNWNTPGDTIECLESVLAAADHPRQVVLVDNASTDDSVERIGRWASERGVRAKVVRDGEENGADVGDAWLLLIASRTVRGFSANNNLGLRYFRDRTPASGTAKPEKVRAVCRATLAPSAVALTAPVRRHGGSRDPSAIRNKTFLSRDRKRVLRARRSRKRSG